MRQSGFLLFLLAIYSGVSPADPAKWPKEGSVQALTGREVYVQSCARCHSAGVGGAPRPGSGVEWFERSRRGPAELMLSVLRGKGGMPPKGGNASLTRVEAYLALDYMLNGDQ